VLKPRFLAGAIGIRKVLHEEELWRLIEALGDDQSNYLIEKYVPGHIYHVDSVVYENELLFACASRYGRPPMDVSHTGGVFTSTLVERGTGLHRSLLEKNAAILKAMRLLRGVSHTELIESRADGKIYFLETAARVGGAHIADLVDHATGVNLWREWAKIEIAGGKQPYKLPPVREDYAALLVSLARQEHPDTSGFRDPELVWRMNKRHHVGFIVRSPQLARVEALLDSYVERVREEFYASAPPRETATD
jgi:biotin carboxylase